MERWKINLYVVWLSQVISLMGFGLCLPFIPFYIQEMGITSPEQLKFYTGLINSAPALAMAIMAPIWGILSDKYGKKLMMLRAGLSAVFILTLMGLVTDVNHLVILRIIQGFLTGTVTAALTLISSGTPNHRMSYALGFLSSSTFIGYSTGPAIGGLIADGIGYKSTFFIGATLMLTNFLLVLLFVKENRESLVKEHEAVESGDINAYTAAQKKKALSTIIISMLAILFFMRISRMVFTPFLPLFIQEMRGVIEGSARITGYISGIAGLLTAFAGIILGRLGDKYSKIKVIRVFILAGIVISIPLVFLHNLWSFAIVYSLMMFSVGGIEPVIMSLTSERTPKEKRGFLFGMQTLVGSLGWTISPIIGVFVSIRYSFSSLIILMPIILGLAFLASLILRSEKLEENYVEKSA